mgnify:CR=1 FL=1
MQDLSNYRKSYEKNKLLENSLPEDPINLFHKWFFEAKENENNSEINAMTLATIGKDGFPKSRVVLLKKFNEDGFIFFTNYLSEKGNAIQKNPNVCLSFFWQKLERQVIIKGIAEKTDTTTSDNYFVSRPKGSQLGALASDQSSVIESREALDNKLKNLEEEYSNKEILRPNFWGGFLVRPIQVEFWQGRPNRMHDRIRYTLQEDFIWKIERLEP